MDQMLFNLSRATWALPDPGTGKAIKVQRAGIVQIATGASGETNTLAAPVKEGILLALSMKSDGGGDRVITVASAINQAGNTVITLNDTGDFILLLSVAYGSTKGVYRWRVVVNDGASLS